MLKQAGEKPPPPRRSLSPAKKPPSPPAGPTGGGGGAKAVAGGRERKPLTIVSRSENVLKDQQQRGPAPSPAVAARSPTGSAGDVSGKPGVGSRGGNGKPPSPRTPRAGGLEPLTPSPQQGQKKGGGSPSPSGSSPTSPMLCVECTRAASEGAVCFIGNDGRVSACTTRSAVRLCKNLNCAANNPDYVAALAAQPKKYLVSKRHQLKALYATPPLKPRQPSRPLTPPNTPATPAATTPQPPTQHDLQHEHSPSSLTPQQPFMHDQHHQQEENDHAQAPSPRDAPEESSAQADDAHAPLSPHTDHGLPHEALPDQVADKPSVHGVLAQVEPLPECNDETPACPVASPHLPHHMTQEGAHFTDDITPELHDAVKQEHNNTESTDEMASVVDASGVVDNHEEKDNDEPHEHDNGDIAEQLQQNTEGLPIDEENPEVSSNRDGIVGNREEKREISLDGDITSSDEEAHSTQQLADGMDKPVNGVALKEGTNQIDGHREVEQEGDSNNLALLAPDDGICPSSAVSIIESGPEEEDDDRSSNSDNGEDDNVTDSGDNVAGHNGSLNGHSGIAGIMNEGQEEQEGEKGKASRQQQRRRRQIMADETINPETVTLRKQQVQERKPAEEWMPNHAIEEVVHKLAPTGETKVKVLVEAFEAIISHADAIDPAAIDASPPHNDASS